MTPIWAVNGRESAGAAHKLPFVAAVQTNEERRTGS
jgi:hypothetical protein